MLAVVARTGPRREEDDDAEVHEVQRVLRARTKQNKSATRVIATGFSTSGYLGDATGDGGGEEVGKPDDVDELAEEDEEDRHGGAVRARAQRPHRHQHVVPPVREREQLQERHLGRHFLIRRRLLLLPAAPRAAALLARRRAHASRLLRRLHVRRSRRLGQRACWRALCFRV
jgi:hypothetical protein